MGVVRHADAGYETAIDTAKNKNVDIPMLKGERTMNDILIQNIGELILPKKTEGPLKGKELNDLKIVNNGTVVVKDGKSYMQENIQKSMKRKK